MLVAIYPTLGVAAVTFLAVFVCMWRVEQDELEDLMEDAEADADAEAEADAEVEDNAKDTNPGNEKKDEASELNFEQKPVNENGIKKEQVRNWEPPSTVAKSGRTKPALGPKKTKTTALDHSKSAHHHDHMARRAAKMSRSLKSAKRAKGMATKQKVVRDVMNQYVFFRLLLLLLLLLLLTFSLSPVICCCTNLLLFAEPKSLLDGHKLLVP